MKERIKNKILKNDFIFVCIIYVGTVILHAVLSNYSRSTITSYNDEYLYWDMARNIFYGNGPIITGINSNFDKIAYPMIIAPFFAISNVVLRVRILTIFNSIVILSSLFPLWLITKEIGLKRSNIFCLLIISALSSDMLLSMTFLSEILYWPLFVWFIYLWLLNVKRPRIYYTVMEGILCYVGYLCREMFLCVFLAYLAVEICFPVLEFVLDKENKQRKLKGYFDKKRIINCGLFVLTFLFCRIAINMLAFQKLQGSYGTVVSSKMFSNWNVYKLAYLIYGFVYYIAAMLISLYVLPLVLPIIRYKDLDKHIKRLFFLISAFLLILCATVSYTILLNENIGDITPAVILRYFAPVFPIFMAVFLKSIQDEIGHRVNRLAACIFLFSILLFSCTMFKGSRVGGYMVHTLLDWYRVLKEKIGILTIGDSNHLIVYPYAILAAGFVILFTLIVYWLYIHNFNRMARNLWFIAMLCICIGNSALLYKEHIYRNTYVDKEIVDEVAELNEYFKSQGDSCTILYLNSEDKKTLLPLRRAIDTYLDYEKNLYVIDSKVLRGVESRDDYFLSISERIYKSLQYRPERFDYIVINNTEYWEAVQLVGVESIPEISGKYYTVYKNLDSRTIIAEPKINRYFTGEEFEISFSGNSYNADLYVQSGLSYKEENFSWIGSKMQVSIPLLGDYERLAVHLNVAATLNEGKQTYIVRQNEDVLALGTIDGAKGIFFIVPVEGDHLSFEIEFPDAKIVEFTPDSNGVIKNFDIRKLSCALHNIKVNLNEGFYFSKNDLTIQFAGNDYNADIYINSGLSHKEEEFSWTSGKRMQVNIPLAGESEAFEVKFNIVETFDGKQSYIVRQDENILLEGKIEGAGEISFIALAEGNALSFEIEFPDARVVNQVVSRSEDSRMLALAIKSMEVKSRKDIGYRGEKLVVEFAGEDYNADLYIRSGIAHKEDTYSWTSGNVMEVCIPVIGDFDNLAVVMKVGDPFNGKQSYVIRQGSREILNGVVEKPGEIYFTVPVEENYLSFEIELPDAQMVSQVNSESNDQRMLALQMLEITVNSSR